MDRRPLRRAGGVVAGRRELIGAIRGSQIDTGGTLAPSERVPGAAGLETLHVRMERHSARRRSLWRAMSKRPGCRAPPRYPGLPTHPQFEVAQRTLRAGGGMLASSSPTARRGNVARRADAAAAHCFAGECPHDRSSPAVEAPPPDGRGALAAVGIPEGLVRVSVGLEDDDDLIADFDQALAAARARSGCTGVGPRKGDHHQHDSRRPSPRSP